MDLIGAKSCKTKDKDDNNNTENTNIKELTRCLSKGREGASDPNPHLLQD